MFLNYLLDCLPAAVLQFDNDKVNELHVRTCVARTVKLSDYTGKNKGVRTLFQDRGRGLYADPGEPARITRLTADSCAVFGNRTKCRLGIVDLWQFISLPSLASCAKLWRHNRSWNAESMMSMSVVPTDNRGSFRHPPALPDCWASSGKPSKSPGFSRVSQSHNLVGIVDKSHQPPPRYAPPPAYQHLANVCNNFK